MDARRAVWAKYDHVLMSESDEKAKKRVEVLEEYLRRFKGIAEKANAALVIMFIPEVSNLYHPEDKNINRVLREKTTKIGIPFVDMTPIFEQSKDLHTYYLVPKDAHTNANGHRAMARALTTLICEIVQTVSCTHRTAEVRR
jgi:hypothetical protein